MIESSLFLGQSSHNFYSCYYVRKTRAGTVANLCRQHNYVELLPCEVNRCGNMETVLRMQKCKYSCVLHRNALSVNRL